MPPGDPLVSCVMPTRDRRRFIAASVACFLYQTYRNRELVILDDGHEEIRDQFSRYDSRIRYFYEEIPRILGDKRDRINELAQGNIICHWDDDDWSAPGRIEDQVRRLLDNRKQVTGYGTMLFWDMVAKKKKKYVGSKSYVCGTSLCYFKEYWKNHRFPAIQKASDNPFIREARKNIAQCHDTGMMVARIHDKHTSSKSGIKPTTDEFPQQFWVDNILVSQSNA